jgi:hypothetical protein
LDEKIYICGIITGGVFQSCSRPGDKTPLRTLEDATELALEKAKVKGTYYVFKVVGKAMLPEQAPVFEEFKEEANAD